MYARLCLLIYWVGEMDMQTHIDVVARLYIMWLCQGVGDRELFVKIFTERLNYVFFQNWSERLSMSSRAIFYKSIKLNWSFGQYLEHVNCRLRIETGRWERPPVPREMRQCEICHQGIEDEFHFVCVCPAYVHISERNYKAILLEETFNV